MKTNGPEGYNVAPFPIKAENGMDHTKMKQTDGIVPPRVYLDKTVVPTLLEGMKLLATERPSDPLAFLGQFLLNRSSEKQK
ncbi:hypothetical protein G6F56_011129 [Rhizopus delemar]|nr:hypothetical protein G6F56_011129 [Rhizopus delemar]